MVSIHISNFTGMEAVYGPLALWPLMLSVRGGECMGSGMKGSLFPSQAEMDMISWGVDLASVEQHIGSHRAIHNAIGDYRWQLDKIKADLVL